MSQESELQPQSVERNLEEPLAANNTPNTPDKPDGATIELVSFSPPQVDFGPDEPVTPDRPPLIPRKVLLLLVGLGLLALVLVLFLVGPRRYNALRAWRATQLALQGEDFIRKNQIEQALASIQSAYTLSPQAPEVLRASAQLFTVYGAPEATSYWKLLLQTTDATDDDRRSAINCAMQYGLFDTAWTMIKDLLARNAGDSRNELLAARWSAIRGTPSQAMLYATRAVNDDPNNKDALLFLAGQEFNNTYLHHEAVDLLFQLANSDDNYGLAALHHLALDSNLNPAEIDRLIARPPLASPSW